MHVVSFEELLKIATAYSSEWGYTNIRIAVPTHWQELADCLTDSQKQLIEFSTDCSISVRAVMAGQTMTEYTADAFAVLQELTARVV